MRGGLTLLLFAVAGAPAHADPAEGACELVRGSAAAEADVLVAPELFTTFAESSSAGAGSVPLGSPTPRLLVGLSYSASNLAQGLTLRARAEAECARARALQPLRSAIDQGAQLGAGPALEARSQVLEAALKPARAIVEQVRRDVQSGQSSREELDALGRELDALESLAQDTELARARLGAGSRTAGSLAAALRAYRAADDDVERLAGTLRSEHTWDVSVKGGYERLFEIEQNVPLFGMITVSYNLGGLWQRGANARARAGRREAGQAVDGVERSVARLEETLRATLASERARLEQVRPRVADLEAQARELDALPTHQVDHFRHALFFERVRARAELAYLQAHVDALSRLVESPR